MASFWCDTGIFRYDMVRFGTIRVCFGTIWICFGPIWYDSVRCGYVSVQYGRVRYDTGMFWSDKVRFGTIWVCIGTIRYGSEWHGYVSVRCGTVRYDTDTVRYDTGIIRCDVVWLGTIRVYFSAMWCSRLWFGSFRRNTPRYGIIRRAQRTMCYGMLRYQTKTKKVNQDHLQYSIEYYSIPKFLIWIMFFLHCIFQHQKALTFVPQEKLRSSLTRQKQWKERFIHQIFPTFIQTTRAAH